MAASFPTAPFAAEIERFLPLIYLAAALMVGLLAILLVSRWRRSQPSLGPNANEELASYRTLYEQGAISEEEYRKLRSLLGGEIRKGLDLPGASEKGTPARPTPPAPPGTDPH